MVIEMYPKSSSFFTDRTEHPQSKEKFIYPFNKYNPVIRAANIFVQENALSISLKQNGYYGFEKTESYVVIQGSQSAKETFINIVTDCEENSPEFRALRLASEGKDKPDILPCTLLTQEEQRLIDNLYLQQRDFLQSAGPALTIRQEDSILYRILEPIAKKYQVKLKLPDISSKMIVNQQSPDFQTKTLSA